LNDFLIQTKNQNKKTLEKVFIWLDWDLEWGVGWARERFLCGCFVFCLKTSFLISCNQNFFFSSHEIHRAKRRLSLERDQFNFLDRKINYLFNFY
jgi:hypothetical protein